MKKTLTLAKRISIGYALLFLICGTFGGFAVIRMFSSATGATFLSEAVVPQVSVANELAHASSIMSRAVRTYGLTGESRYLDEAKVALKNIDEEMLVGARLYEAHPQLTALKEGLSAAQAALTDYRADIDATQVLIERLATVRATLDGAAAAFMQSAGSYIESQNASFSKEIEDGAESTA